MLHLLRTDIISRSCSYITPLILKCIPYNLCLIQIYVRACACNLWPTAIQKLPCIQRVSHGSLQIRIFVLGAAGTVRTKDPDKTSDVRERCCCPVLGSSVSAPSVSADGSCCSQSGNNLLVTFLCLSVRYGAGCMEAD